MKKLLTLSLSVLSIVAFASTAVVTKDSGIKAGALNAASETTEVKIERVEGTQTETSVTVDFYYNHPSKGIARRYYVEPGTKIESFRRVMSGWTFKGWFYDRVGTMPFDFETEIHGDLKLYGYFVPYGSSVETGYDPYEEEIGTYKLTWNPGAGNSFMIAEGGILPSYAEEGDVINFYMKHGYGNKTETVVTANGNELTSVEGMYSYTVGTEPVVFASSDVKIIETELLFPTCYLVINNDESTKIEFKSHNYEEVKLTGVELKKGDTFYVLHENGNKYSAIKEGNPFVSGFTAPWAGAYDFYFDFKNFYTWVEAPLDPDAVYTSIYFTKPNDWNTAFYYVWDDSQNAATGWPGVEMTFVETNDFGQGVYKCDVATSKYTNIIFNNGNGGGSNQTVNIKLPSNIANNSAYYVDRQDGEGKWTVGTWTYGA